MHPCIYVCPPVVVHVSHVLLCDVVTAVIVVRLGTCAACLAPLTNTAVEPCYAAAQQWSGLQSVDSCRSQWTPAEVCGLLQWSGRQSTGLHCGLLMMMNAFHNHINPFLCSIIVIGSESFKKAL